MSSFLFLCLDGPSLLLTLPNNARLLLSHLAFLFLPYPLARSKPFYALLLIHKCLLSAFTLLDHTFIGLFELETAVGYEELVKVLILDRIEARVRWRSDLKVVLKLEIEGFGEDDVVVSVGDLETVSECTRRRRWA